MKVFVSIIIGLYLTATWCQENPYISVKRNFSIFKTDFEITVVTKNEDIGYINIEEIVSELRRVEKLITADLEDSEVSRINANAGVQPVKVSPEIFKLIQRAIQLSQLTDGAFDITDGVLDDLWRFDGSITYMPTSAEINSQLDRVGYQKIQMNEKEHTVFLTKKGMRITFDFMGIGYAIDSAKEFMASKGVKAGSIKGGTIIATWGTKATGDKWLLGIANPNPMRLERIFSWVPIVESAVATCGNNDAFITFNNLKYGSNIDPRTGYPAIGVQNVSVFAKSAEYCAALSKAIAILGITHGMAIINQLDATEAIIITNDYALHKSKAVSLHSAP
ncbi:FAD:protein FMN transferase [Arenibacter sp. GZD96]|uniref:FAD:protein FMN transferase n=1 Tax=Aurantibrevibacter litoralis TaxID=3106030 RepID=UPI002AFF85D2|nr:FAD:protein FMN transferase [Arenibacter sp. GZD-96]MEA1787020.1 FAD:protein FMN transferase [Arenibacter sp. GZD-96]